MTLNKIIEYFLKEYDIKLNLSTVHVLSDKFLSLISGVHYDKVSEIRKVLKYGYILTIDGTISTGSRTLYVVKDYISSLILHSELVEIKDADTFVKPICVVSDMQGAILNAVKEVLSLFDECW